MAPVYVIDLVAFVGAIGGVAGMIALYKASAEKAQTKASTESIHIRTASDIVKMLTEQVQKQEKRIRMLEAKVVILDSEVRKLGGDPERLYREFLGVFEEMRSEERRVGKECRSRGAPCH